MAKGKGRTAASHIDNYRRGGLRLGNLGERWIAKQEINPQEILNGIAPQQGGKGMNGMNNPLGALSALAGLAQSKNDPMAALSALSALSGGPAGGAASTQTNPTQGAGTSTNPADLINILSKLKPQGGNQASPTGNTNNGTAANAQNSRNTNYQGNRQTNQDNSGYNTPPPYGSNQAGAQSTQAYRQGTQGVRQNQQEQSDPPPRRRSEMRQRTQRLFAEEPKSGCEGCSKNCGGSFRNYPKWSDINSAAAPWRKKGEHND